MHDVATVIQILNGKSTYRLPEFITQWKNIYYRMSIHTTGVCPAFYPLRWEQERYVLSTTYTYPLGWLNAIYDTIFDDFLFNRHAREDNLTREWRKSVYRPYQQAVFQKTIDKCGATIMAENKYTLIVENDDDNKYIWGKNFAGKNLVDFMSWHIKAICEDPNSLFFVVPKEAYDSVSTEKVEPEIIHVPTRSIIFWDGQQLIFTQDQYAWYVNDDIYLRFQKDSKDRYKLTEQNGFYRHSLGRMPIHFAGGVWNTHGYYDSYLKPAQAFADDFVASHSAVQMIDKECSHPYITAASRDCPECEGKGIMQWCNKCKCRTDVANSSCTCDNGYGNNLWSTIACNKCHGTAQQSYNPSEWLIVPPSEMGNDLIKITSPDVSVNEYLAKRADDLYIGIEKSLHQQHVEEAQSGVAKEIDRDGEYLFYATMSNGIWGLTESLLIDVLSIRNTSKSEGSAMPEIPKYILIKPMQFDLKTENDLLEEYKVSTESNMPDFVRQMQVECYVDKVYAGNDLMLKKTKAINQLDCLSLMTATDKATIAPIVGNRQVQFSVMLPKIIDKVIRIKQPKWFLDATIDEIDIEVQKEWVLVPEVLPPAPVVSTPK